LFYSAINDKSNNYAASSLPTNEREWHMLLGELTVPSLISTVDGKKISERLINNIASTSAELHE